MGIQKNWLRTKHENMDNRLILLLGVQNYRNKLSFTACTTQAICSSEMVG